MARFSTGPVDNQSEAEGRLAQLLTLKAVNRDSLNAGTVLIEGFIISGSRTLYVQELVSLSPNQVLSRNYFCNVPTIKPQLPIQLRPPLSAKIHTYRWKYCCGRASCI